MNRSVLAMLLPLVVSACCTNVARPPSEDEIAAEPSSERQPVQHPEGPPPTPPEAPEGITVISVPAVVTEREAQYVGEARDDIHPMEETVPLGAQSVPTMSDSLDSLRRASALLGWTNGEPLPEPLEKVDAEGCDSVGLDAGDLLIGRDPEPERIPLSAFFPNAARARVGCDAEQGRTIVVALTRTPGVRVGLPVLMAVNQGADPALWYTVSLEVEGQEESSVVFELVAHDEEAWYVLAANADPPLPPEAHEPDYSRRSVWVVSKAFPGGEQTAVTLLGSRAR